MVCAVLFAKKRERREHTPPDGGVCGEPMKVKMILEPDQPVRECSNSYGNRLIEQGKAIFQNTDTPVAETQEQGWEGA